MKCLVLYTGKRKKNITKLSSDKLAKTVVKVKAGHNNVFSWNKEKITICFG